MPGMEQRILDAINELGGGGTHTQRIVQTRPPTKRTATHPLGGTVITAAQVFALIEFDQALGVPPEWLWMQPNQNCALEFTLASDPNTDVAWPPGLIAGIQLLVTDENWIRMRVTPAVYPCNLLWLATSSIPRGAKEPPAPRGEASTGPWLAPVDGE